MAKKTNKPITEKDVEKFKQLVEQGMLEHLEANAHWHVVDDIHKHLSKFTEKKDDEIFNTPNSIAEYYYNCDKELELLKRVCYFVAKSKDPKGALEVVADNLDVDLKDFAEDVEPLDNYASGKNLNRMRELLEMRPYATRVDVLNELQERL